MINFWSLCTDLSNKSLWCSWHETQNKACGIREAQNKIVFWEMENDSCKQSVIESKINWAVHPYFDLCGDDIKKIFYEGHPSTHLPSPARDAWHVIQDFCDGYLDGYDKNFEEMGSGRREIHLLGLAATREYFLKKVQKSHFLIPMELNYC